MKYTRRNLLKAGLLAAPAAVAGAAIAGNYAFNILKPKARRVVFIIADAMRGDRLGYTRKDVNGRDYNLTPGLSEIARMARVYERAISPSSWTPTSMSAIMYDRNPLISSPYDHSLDKSDSLNESMAEFAASRGYRTMMVTANEILSLEPLKRGFDKSISLKSTGKPGTLNHRV